MDRHRGTYDGPVLPFVIIGAPIFAIWLLVRGVKNVTAWAGDNPALAVIVLAGVIGLIASAVWLRKQASVQTHWSERGIKED